MEKKEMKEFRDRIMEIRVVIPLDGGPFVEQLKQS
jgi:hypothetical protein